MLLVLILICLECSSNAGSAKDRPKTEAEREQIKETMIKSFARQGWQYLDNDFSGRYFSISFPDWYLVFKKNDRTEQDVIFADYPTQNDENAHVTVIFAKPAESSILDYWETASDEEIKKGFEDVGKTVSIEHINKVRFVKTVEKAKVRYFTVKNGIDLSIYAPNALKEKHRRDFAKAISTLKIK